MSNRARQIVARTRGGLHGFIRRLVSPGELGERLKPFVFLDHVNGAVPDGAGFGFHPHSGIATLTYSLNSDAAYEDTAGQKGIVRATGLEWMRAGGGTWHQGFIHPLEPIVTAFQLWLALPPGVEDGPPEGIYVAPEEVPEVGGVRVLLGTYEGRTNPIPLPSPVTYLDVSLEAGRPWRFAPPEGQTVGWACVYRGQARILGEAVSGELVVLDDSTAEVVVEADAPARVLFGCARPHAYPLVLGSHSVHTNEASLRRGVARIAEVGAQLRRQGRL
jgi:redox-sensitive bicupin YhaK (pirin superfamily)